MREKTTWMLFLLIGTSCLLIQSCESTIEPRVDADLIYKNETNHAINYSGIFHLNPNSTDTIRIIGVGGKNYNLESCCQGGLENFLDSYQQVYLILDEILCVFYEENEGPTSLANYDARIISKDNYEYTFRFTEEQFVGSVACPD